MRFGRGGREPAGSAGNKQPTLSFVDDRAGFGRSRVTMKRDIIAIGGSAGSLDTLREIVRAFPPDFSGNLFIVTHIGLGRSRLPDVLGSATAIPICFATDRDPIMAGRIYVAPTDRHMLLEPGSIRLSHGPREHFTRPAIDPLFRSGAIAYRARVIGVILSGGGSDGAAGLDTIKRAGGV